MTPTFFTDRDLGKQFPAILKDAGLSVVRHVDLFRPETPDEEWLERVGREGWLAITHDGRIRYKPNEQAAVVRHRVALFVVRGPCAACRARQELREHPAAPPRVRGGACSSIHRQGVSACTVRH